jgi:glycine/D-amino acid oxidase-like deaminating enzyme
MAGPSMRILTMAAPVLPDRARVVVIGGGVIGTSVAYHLAHMGWKDVVLLERDRITSGTTWHAAGLVVTFGSTSETSTDVQEISPAEVKTLFPLARVDDILAGFYVADDGRANPVDVTMALAKGARMAGARLIEGVRVDGVLRQGSRVTGVRTALGDIEAEYVVNCAGMWARHRCRCSKIRRRTAISAKRSAACWSACSSRSARRGTSTAFRKISHSARFRRTGSA